MSLTYFKRFRMEIDVASPPCVPLLPDGYFFVPWDDDLADLHADVHFYSFCDELDSTLFPCFSDRHGCQYLIREIAAKENFIPEATWMIACGEGCCGTIQGVRDRQGYGSIQNVGIVPRHRGQGLGSALIAQALQGFWDSGLRKAFLEVTADNDRAVRLYQRLGFRRMKTSYKAVDV